MNKFIDTNGFPHKTEKQKIIAEFHIKLLEVSSGMSFIEIVESFSEIQRFQFALKHLTTTSSVVSAIFGSYVKQKNSCRYKSFLEENCQLVASTEEVICPYTGFKARLLTTNPLEFEKLKSTNQLRLFD